jgi:predicted anti-sigma-YlaC factor YlaD
MSDCVNSEVRDALPDLFHGRLTELDTATMKAHVESCAACRAELEIIRQAKALAAIAPTIDATRIAASIKPYGAASVTTPRKSIIAGMSSLRLAAAAVLVAIGTWALASGRDDSAPARQAVATASETSTAGPDEGENPARSTSNSTATAVAGPAAETQVASLSLVGNTADLSDADLEQLVAELDAIETLPSAEPQSITITDEDLGSENDSIN